MEKITNSIHYFHIDAFTSRPFSGNPAAVCVMDKPLVDDDLMQAIATEVNLSVTAFIYQENTRFHIRWFTPEYELPLCGHGTLAAAFVIFTEITKGIKTITFVSPTAGEVTASAVSGLALSSHDVIEGSILIELHFPEKKPAPIETPAALIKGLGQAPVEVQAYKEERLMAVLEDERAVHDLVPSMEFLQRLPYRGVVVTAKGSDVDFVSRTFYPHKALMQEDPVTGASHCMLVPYWAKRLNKTSLHALQVSSRGGELFCRYEGERVVIGGCAVKLSSGNLFI